MRLRTALEVSSGSTVMMSTAVIQYSSIILNYNLTAYAQVGTVWDRIQPWAQYAPASQTLSRSGLVESSGGGFAGSCGMKCFRMQGFWRTSEYTTSAPVTRSKGYLYVIQSDYRVFSASFILVVYRNSAPHLSQWTGLKHYPASQNLQKLRFSNCSEEI